MKAKSIALLLCLLIAPSIYSQRIQVENGDTVAVIPIDQIRSANVLFIQKDSLQGEVNFCKYQIAALDSANQINRSIIKEYQTIGLLQDARISILKEQILVNEKNAKKRSLNAFLSGTAVGATVILLISLLI